MLTEREALARARGYFLTEDNTYGCAETTLMVLQEAFELSDSHDASPAMALNGGIAWSGGGCGAITGAAVAVGRLAARRIDDHKEAKHAARNTIAGLMASFRDRYGHVNCRDLVGLDICTDEGHAAFIESRIWQTVCMAQIEFVVRELLLLQHSQSRM